MLKHALFIVACLASYSAAKAEDYNQPQLQSIADSFVAELQKAGAKDVTKADIRYDSASKTLQISDFRAEFPASVQKEKSEDSDTSKSSVKSENSGASAETKVTREATELKIARIIAANLTYNGASWLADSVRVESVSVSLKGKPDSFDIAAIEFKMIDAPRIDAATFAKEFGESLITLVQDSSYAGALLSGAIFKGENAGEDKLGKMEFKFGDISISKVAKGKGALMSMAPSTLITASVDEADKKGAAESGKTITTPGKTFTKKDSDEGKSKVTVKSDEDDSDSNNDDSGETLKPFRMDLKKAEITDFDIGLYADFFRSKPRRAGQKDQPLYATASSMERASQVKRNSLSTLGPLQLQMRA